MGEVPLYVPKRTPDAKGGSRCIHVKRHKSLLVGTSPYEYCRDTSLIRNRRLPLGPYSRTMPRALRVF